MTSTSGLFAAASGAMSDAMASGRAETPGAVAPAPPEVATAARIRATIGGKVSVFAMILAAA